MIVFQPACGGIQSTRRGGGSAFPRMNADESLNLSTGKAERRLQRQLNNGATWTREGSPLPVLFPRALWLTTREGHEESQALCTPRRNKPDPALDPSLVFFFFFLF